jgi:exodeoxyribonuclease I
MDKIVIYDTETTNSTIWGSIIEVGAVVCDKNLNEIGKLNIRGRMPEGEVPSAKALLVNSTSIDLLTKGNYSHYDFLGAVENFFSKVAPAMFMGWSNLNFDRRMFHFNFFKGNRYPYATHSSPNQEHDGLHIARAAHTINSETLKTELTPAGNTSLALESLARMQGFDTSQQHTAYHDAYTSLKVLRIIKNNHKDNWKKFLSTSTKSSVETILKSDGIYSIFENVKGRNMMYLVTTLHPNHCFHPSYASWGYVFDLRRDPEPLLNMPVNELKANLKKISPKALRVLKTNKAPVILDKQFALKQKPYSDIDLETIQKRAKLVRSNEKFCQNIQIINREIAEDKEQTKTQEDLLPEETLYEKFIPNKDTALFKTWHSSSWEDKLRQLDKFQDKRCSWFGQKIIYQEAPQVLPPDLYKNIKSEIARRILSQNKEKWQTIGMAYNEIDILRDQASNRDDEEELKKLDEINEFIMSIEKKYEIA